MSRAADLLLARAAIKAAMPESNWYELADEVMPELYAEAMKRNNHGAVVVDRKLGGRLKDLQRAWVREAAARKAKRALAASRRAK